MFEWVEPTLGEAEGDYQRHHLGDDVRHARFVLRTVAVATIIDSITAGFFIESSTRMLQFATLAAEGVLTVLATALARRVSSRAMFERLIFGWCVSYSMVVLAMRALDSEIFPESTVVLLSLGAYLLLPNRLAFRVLTAGLLTAGNAAVTIWLQRVTPSAYVEMLLLYGFVHVVGIWGSSRLNTSRRHQFRAQRIMERTQAELVRLARTDALTGLASRAAWFASATDELTRCRRYARPLAFMMIDLDRFKEINDRFGHQVGDDVLRRFAEALNGSCRASDVVGRFGGEEFVVCLPETGLHEATEVARRLLETCREVRVTGVPALEVTCSVGVTEIVPDDVTIDRPLGRADAALYEAKNSGRNRVEAA